MLTMVGMISVGIGVAGSNVSCNMGVLGMSKVGNVVTTCVASGISGVAGIVIDGKGVIKTVGTKVI